MLSRTLETTLDSTPNAESTSSLYNQEQPSTFGDGEANWAGMAVVGSIFTVIGVFMLATSSVIGGGVIFVGILLIIGARYARKWEADDEIFSDQDYQWEQEAEPDTANEYISYRDEERQREIEEIVKAVKTTIRVRCRYCGTLNEEKANKCESCGASL